MRRNAPLIIIATHIWNKNISIKKQRRAGHFSVSRNINTKTNMHGNNHTYRYMKFRMVIIKALNNIRFIIFRHVIEWESPDLPNYNHKLPFVVRHPPP